METQDFELPGSLSMQDQSLAIEGAEAAGRKFAGARIYTNGVNRLSNLATFELLDTRPEPPLGTPVLKRSVGSGEVAAWSGPMIVEGTALDQVFLIRVAA